MKNTEIEAIVEKGKAQKEDIKKSLQKLGSSLVIGESDNYYKIHIHTKNEEKVLRKIRKFGKIVSLRKIPLP